MLTTHYYPSAIATGKAHQLEIETPIRITNFPLFTAGAFVLIGIVLLAIKRQLVRLILLFVLHLTIGAGTIQLPDTWLTGQTQTIRLKVEPKDEQLHRFEAKFGCRSVLQSNSAGVSIMIRREAYREEMAGYLGN